jgi:esterase/lipase
MQYFSGFSLQNEQELFNFWLKDCNNYCIAGFSYGAIKAVEEVLNSNKRVDRLILLSPAYFNDKKRIFIRAQLLYFKKDSQNYINNFLQNISEGSSINLIKYLRAGTTKELQELLTYNWDIKKLKKIAENGVRIEVILAENDKIINSKEALNFFEKVCNVYYIKNANHILKEIKNGN